MGEDWTCPDAIEPLVGYRAWESKGPTLRSVYKQYEWKPGENVAACVPTMPGIWMGGRMPGARPEKHIEGVVDIKCHCGFWAMNTIELLAVGSGNLSKPSTIWGKVLGYGRVAVGRKGFRAEKARIVELYLRPKQEEIFVMHLDSNRLNRLAEDYGVSVIPLQSDNPPSPPFPHGIPRGLGY